MDNLSANGLAKIREKDSTFPQPIKFGDSRQAPVFYDLDEWEAWYESKLAERHPETAPQLETEARGAA